MMAVHLTSSSLRELSEAMRAEAVNDRECDFNNLADDADSAAEAIDILSGGFRTELIAAAGQAAMATEALIRAHRHNEPVDDDTLEKLLDAAKLLIEAEGLSVRPEVEELYAALTLHLEGWA